jgi:hypothetical protein
MRFNAARKVYSSTEGNRYESHRIGEQESIQLRSLVKCSIS